MSYLRRKQHPQQQNKGNKNTAMFIYYAKFTLCLKTNHRLCLWRDYSCEFKRQISVQYTSKLS